MSSIQAGKAQSPQVLKQNLQVMESHVKLGGGIKAHQFRISKNSKNEEIIKTNGIIRRVVLYPYYHSSTHLAKIENFAKATVSQINIMERGVFVEYPDLGTQVQRFDQAALSQKDRLTELIKEKSQEIGKLNERHEGSSKKISKSRKKLEKEMDHLQKKGEPGKKGRVMLPKITNVSARELHGIGLYNVEKMDVPVAQSRDRPVIVQEKRLGLTFPIRRYQTDVGIDHSEEASRIFLSTQMERLLSTTGRILKTLGYEAKAFDQFAYASEEDRAHIYRADNPLELTESLVDVRDATPEPKSFWLGHATCLLSIPLRSLQDESKVATVRVITDPVEGDLNAILYPRMTKFARRMEEIPVPQVYLLSHNHLDHYSKETIEKLLSGQPVIVVPQGDGWRYKKLGFKNIQELNWWEGADLTFKQDKEMFSLKIEAIPARHWAGQGPCGGHSSTFLGYMIHGHEDGPIYFAGDTAPLDYVKKATKESNQIREYRWYCNDMATPELKETVSNLKASQVKGDKSKDTEAKLEVASRVLELKELGVRCSFKEREALLAAMEFMNQGEERLAVICNEKAKYFAAEAELTQKLAQNGEAEEYSHMQVLREKRPTYFFAPGGPDDDRADMKTTHQSSAYGVQEHANLMLHASYEELAAKGEVNKDAFIEAALKKKTMYMHTMTFKLGNLKLMDTRNSVENVLKALHEFEFRFKSSENVTDRIEAALKDAADKKFGVVTDKMPEKKRLKRENWIRVRRDSETRQATKGISTGKGLRSYEWEVVKELIDQAHEWRFADKKRLSLPEFADLLEQTIIIPKIGSNLGLRDPNPEQVIFGPGPSRYRPSEDQFEDIDLYRM